MRIMILGSSGNSCTPWPTCDCRICTKARLEGGKDVRYGNHLYLPDSGILTDASEHVFHQLNRFGVMDVRHLFISHWHPDHTAGLRIIQALAGFFLKEKDATLNVYMTRTVYEETVEKVLKAFDYFLDKTDTRLNILVDGQPVTIDGVTVTPVTLPEEPGGEHTITTFLFEQDGKRVHFAPDETKYLPLERDEFTNLDLLIKECGYFTYDVDGDRVVPEDFHEQVPHEITFDETIEQVRRIGAKRTIVTELEELFGRTHEEYEALAGTYPELNLEFAYDGMEIEL